MSEPINIDTVDKLLETFGNPFPSALNMLMAERDLGLVRLDAERSPDPDILAKFLDKATKRPKMRSLDDDWFS